MSAKPMRTLCRFRRVGSRFVVTNDQGGYVFLDDDGLAALTGNRVGPGTPLEAELREKGFLFDEADVERIAADYGRRTSFLFRGPVLHILVVTLRCNQVCTYCHASRASMRETETDMPVPTAEKAVDLALSSPSDEFTIEFQGGEPLANWEVVTHVVEYALAGARRCGKRVMFSLVSNLSLLDDEKLRWLLDHRIQISTSLDGPRDLHDRNRRLSGASAYDATVEWMGRINAAYRERGLDPDLYHVEALATITRDHLGRGREVVDEYVARGCRALFLRPLNPFGFARNTADRTGYTAQEFLAFYREALDHLLDLNRKGVQAMERLAAIFLTKILTPDDPNYLDIRSPCGAGVGQIAYNHDGRIFTCDEGRMVCQMGDDAFLVGHADVSSLRDVVTHDTVTSIALASCLDSIPGCAQCAYKPYCGTCPVYNYTEQGSIFPQNPTNPRCAIYMGIQDRLFELLMEGDPEVQRIFRNWTTVKPRPEYIHVPGARPRTE
jgi:His-Xaa-Ser system radical SAM maturase HxsB